MPNMCTKAEKVFTLQSIKSRIETKLLSSVQIQFFRFLLYSPLNQGLKQVKETTEKITASWFLLYSPLNQGLKLVERVFS